MSLPSLFCANPNLHAYLYESGDFVKRKETARLMAQSLLCRNQKDGVPCNECDCCKKMTASTHPDCIVVGSGKNTTVEQVRGIENEAYLAPNEAELKVFVLDDADLYSAYTQNALLKIIEEPPENVKFILTASSRASLLATVRSRVCIISDSTKDARSIQLQIMKQMPHTDENTAKTMAHFAAFYERINIKELDFEKTKEFIQNAVGFFSGEKKDAAISFPKKREELSLCLKVYMLVCREIAVAKCTNVISDGFLTYDELCACNAKTSMKKAHALYDIFEEALIYTEENSNINATLAFLSQKL